MFRQVLSLLILFLFSITVPAYAYDFAFVESLEAETEVISLAQLVTPKSEVPDTWAEIKVIDAPGPGRSIGLAASQIKRGLRLAGLDPDKTGVSIPESIQIYRPGQTLLPQQVEEEFQRQLSKVLEIPVLDFQIELVGWSRELVLPLGTVEVAITENPASLRESLLRSYASFSYQITVDGSVVDSGRARIRVSGRVKVPVLTSDKQRHQVLTLADFRWEELDLAKITPDTYLNPEKIVGFRTTRLVRGGLPLKASDVEIPPLVQYRSEVKLSVSFNGVYLETQGKALMDGKMGEIIKVENLSSGKIVSGKVIGPNHVQALI